LTPSQIFVYRIGHPDFIDKLDGEGAARSGGRWNYKGEKVVYTSETSSLAILELLSHISDFSDPVPYQLITITIEIKSLLHYENLSPALPPGWSLHEAGEKITQSIGSHWLNDRKSAVLKVPSVHNPLETNYLLNPMHPDFKAEIVDKHWYLYDNRLRRL
jgi:RES domain-containing protein